MLQSGCGVVGDLSLDSVDDSVVAYSAAPIFFSMY